MGDKAQELCDLCRSPVNPGAIVCASCGAQKWTYHGSTGCLVVAVLVLAVLGPTALWVGVGAIFDPSGTASLYWAVEVPWLLCFGIAWFAYATAKKHWSLRKNPKVHWYRRTGYDGPPEGWNE